MKSWLLKIFLFIQINLLFSAIAFSKKCLASNKGEFSYGGLFLVLIVGVLYIANPKMFHDFFEYMLNLFFDALHSAFGDDPKSDFGSGNKGDANNPVKDGIRLPGQE